MATAPDTPARQCVQCDGKLTGKQRQFCSRSCLERYRAPARGRERREAAALARKEFKCLHCKRWTQPKTAQNTAYCSTACKSAHYREMHPGKAQQWQARRKAKIASQKLYDHPRKPAQCGDCSKNIASRRNLCDACIEQRRAKRCRSCGVIVKAWHRLCGACRYEAKVTTSSRCAAPIQVPIEMAKAPLVRQRTARTDERLVWRPPSDHCASAKRYAAETDHRSERFDPLEVLERDGWRCHLCGRKTPRHLRGTRDERAPELDHIVPLAAGGEHTRRNTACACRKCNGSKGARPRGQLRLIA